MNDELGDLLVPITLNWRVSELKRWVGDYRSDTNADILCFHSEASGYIDIYNEYPRPLVGMRCERPINGAIELIPYILEGATPSAIAELRRWRDALEVAGAMIFEENGRRHYKPIVIRWNRGELFEWLKWHYVTTYTIEPWRNLSSEGELFIYGLCPYSPCAMNVYLRVKDASPKGTEILPRVTVRNDENRQQADAEIYNLCNQLEAAGAMTLTVINPDHASEVYIPSQTARLQKWKKTWQIIKPEVKQNHLTGYEIAAKVMNSQLLRDKLRDCPKGGDTLQKIIKAGLAGMLES